MRDCVAFFAASERPRRTVRPSPRWQREDITEESIILAAWEDAHPESTEDRCACGRAPRADGTCPKHGAPKSTRPTDDL